MRVLVTNDDGIDGEGNEELSLALSKLTETALLEPSSVAISAGVLCSKTLGGIRERNLGFGLGFRSGEQRFVTMTPLGRGFAGR